MQRFTVTVMLLTAVAISLSAQDGLYAPSRPEDAALVRVVNLSAHDESARIDAGPVRFEPLDPATVGPYRPVPTGVYLLGDPERTMFTPAPETFVTIVTGHDPSTPGSVHLFTDEAHDDPARAQLVFYNLTSRILSLVAVPTGTVVFDEVPSQRSRSIAVNAINVDLEIRDGDDALGRTTVDLSRGASFSIFAADAHDERDERLVTAEATVATD